MERLTYRPKAPYVSRATGKLIKAFSDNEVREIIHRLADYEDTGLTPEQCENAKVIIEAAFSDDTAKAERIRELLKADRDGRLVVLPCKVGDTVYRLFAGNPDNPVIATLKINTVTEAVKLIGKMGMHKYIGTFLTHEEAEKALEAMKDD